MADIHWIKHQNAVDVVDLNLLDQSLQPIFTHASSLGCGYPRPTHQCKLGGANFPRSLPLRSAGGVEFMGAIFGGQPHSSETPTLFFL